MQGSENPSLHSHSREKDFKIIYSLRLNLYLQKRGFFPLSEMKNPMKPNFNCWVYETSPEFLSELDFYTSQRREDSNA